MYIRVHILVYTTYVDIFQINHHWQRLVENFCSGRLGALKIHCKTSQDGYSMAVHNLNFLATCVGDPPKELAAMFYSLEPPKERGASGKGYLKVDIPDLSALKMTNGAPQIDSKGYVTKCHYQDVYQLEKRIRRCGLIRVLKFKPDIYSLCGICHGNDLGLRPTILKSSFDTKGQVSEITSDYTQDYEPEICMNGLSYRNFL